MSYSALSREETIILAAECVGLDVPIPHEIQAMLGPELISEIQNPGATHDNEKRNRSHQ